MKLLPLCRDLESLLDRTEDAWQRGYEQGMRDALTALVRLVQKRTKLEVELALFEPDAPTSHSAIVSSSGTCNAPAGLLALGKENGWHRLKA